MAFAPGAAPIKTGATRVAQQAGDRAEVESTGARFAESLITFNYRTIDADILRMRRDATENFAQQFQTALGGDLNVFRRKIINQRAVSTGAAKGSTLLSLDDDTATVLVFTSQTVRTRPQPERRSRFNLVELTLVKTPNWKVDSARNPSVANVSAGE
jgi:hypothetical protein